MDTLIRHRMAPFVEMQLRQSAERFGVSTAELFASTGVTFSANCTKPIELTVDQMIAVVARLCLLTEEPGLGFHLGLELPETLRGTLGMVALMARTLGEGLQLGVGAIQARNGIIVPMLREQGDRATLVLQERIDLGPARDVVLICVLTGLVQIARDVTGFDVVDRIDLTIAEPTYLPRFAGLPVTRRMHFGESENRLWANTCNLDLPLRQPDSTTARADALSERALAPGRVAPWRQRVCALLQSTTGMAPSLDEAARHLGVSARTLKRRLAASGTSYSELSEQSGRARAQEQLLHDETKSIEAIAEQLGYADAPSFIRAFRRWTGMTPARFRSLRRAPRI